MPFPFAPRRALRVVLASGAALALLAGCNGGGGSTAGDTVTVQGDVPIAYAKRSTAVRINPTNGAPSAPGRRGGGDASLPWQASWWPWGWPSCRGIVRHGCGLLTRNACRQAMSS